MFKIGKYERQVGIGQSAHSRTAHGRHYQTRAEARVDAEAAVQGYDHKGYNGEHDYFWGRNDNDETGHIYLIEVEMMP